MNFAGESAKIATPPRSASSLRILLVEDDAVISAIEEELLIELGHTVGARAVNMCEAMRVARDFRPDVAMVDIRLANGDNGLDVGRRLLTECGVQSIFVSGSLFPEDGIGAFIGTGALAFVAKPFSRMSIESALAAAMAALGCADAIAMKKTAMGIVEPPLPEDGPEDGKVQGSLPL